jgi:hypothetical protein
MHVGPACCTAVVHTSPQLPQLLRSFVVFAHSVGRLTGHAVSPALQFRVHAPEAHAGCPAPTVGPGHVFPHAPQLFASCCSSTHAVGVAVGHPLNPPLHVKVHALLTHVGCAFCTLFGQASPHPLQSFALLVVSTHVPLHSVGFPVGQPDEHIPPAHTGAFAGHTLVHEPQVPGFVMSVSQPSSGFPLQSAHPAAHAVAGKLHAPATVHEVAPATCARFVQSCPHVPQLWTSLGTHAPLHSMSPVPHPGGGPSSPASATVPPSPPPSVVPVSAAAIASWWPASTVVPSCAPALSAPPIPWTAGFSSVASSPPASAPCPAPNEPLHPTSVIPSGSESTQDQPNRMTSTLPVPPPSGAQACSML